MTHAHAAAERNTKSAAGKRNPFPVVRNRSSELRVPIFSFYENKKLHKKLKSKRTENKLFEQ